LDTLLKAAEETQTDGLLIYLDGKIVGEYYFGKSPRKVETMSSTKSIVSLAIGKLLTDGKIKSLDQPVSDFYPEWKQGMKSNITLRHLLNHTSGLQNFPSTSKEIYPSPDFVQLALSAEVVNIPGSYFSYNNKAVNLIAGVVRKASGQRMDIYLKEKLFAPLGITDFDWTLDRAGNPHGMSGFQAYPKDFLKLGQLWLQQGLWEGQQIISKEFFVEAGTPGKLSPSCGLLWWIHYEKSYAIIDDAQIDTLKKAGLPEDVIKRINSIKGKYVLEEYIPLFNQKVKAFTPEWDTKYTSLLLNKGLSVSRKEYSKPIGFSTNGYLGNYMVVYPGKNLVVVRLISYQSFIKKGGTQDGTGHNNFVHFFELAGKLVK